MLDFVLRGNHLLGDVIVQTSLALALGLVAARLARSPARVHAALLMTLVAALATPLASTLVRYAGWGVLKPADIEMTQASLAIQPVVRPEIKPASRPSMRRGPIRQQANSWGRQIRTRPTIINNGHKAPRALRASPSKSKRSVRPSASPRRVRHAISPAGLA